MAKSDFLIKSISKHMLRIDFLVASWATPYEALEITINAFREGGHNNSTHPGGEGG